MLPLKQRSGGAQMTSGTRKSSHWICILYLFVLKKFFYHVHVLLIFFKHKGDTGSFSFSPTLQGCPAELTLIVSVTDRDLQLSTRQAYIALSLTYYLGLVLKESCAEITTWEFHLNAKNLKPPPQQNISWFPNSGQMGLLHVLPKAPGAYHCHYLFHIILKSFIP